MATEQAGDRSEESFQGLLLRHRGRTGLTQRELAVRVGVSRGSVQDWEAGLNYPDARHLQALIGVFLQAGGLTVRGEATEAEALWAAALRQAPRMRAPFDAVWWAGLIARRAESSGREGPPYEDLVVTEAPEGEGARLTVLLKLLRGSPCLLVLDNFETVLEAGQREGGYRDGFGGYGALLQALGEARHESCLVLTSRESPPEMAFLVGPAVRRFQLGGLGVQEGQVRLADKHLSGNPEDWAKLI